MKNIIYSISFGFVLLLAGCLNITEEIFLNKNGTGKYISTIDMSGMKDMMAMLKTMGADSSAEGNMNELNDLDSMQNMWKGLEAIEGITDVKREKKDEWVYVISFSFANTKALNEAMTRRKKDGETTAAGDFYAFSKGSFACRDTSLAGMGDLMKGGKGELTGDSTQMALEMMKGFMGDMKYTAIYHLPGKVLSYSNKKAKIGEDGKTVTLVIDLMEDTPEEKTLVNEIKYKK